MLKPFLEKEKFSAYSHLFGAIASIITTIVLIIVMETDSKYKFVASIYGICATCVMSFSAIYHFKKKQDDEVSTWRKLDHSMIFIVIAGTFTPLCYVYLEGAIRWGIIIAQWTFTILGILFKIKFMNAPRWMSLSLFVLMGLIALIPIGTLMEGLRTTGSGALGYFWAAVSCIILGIVVYGTKKPDPKPGVFGFHDIWHVLVILCLMFLFILMFSIFT